MSKGACPDRLTSINSAQGIDLKTLAKLTAASVAALALTAPALAEWQEASSKHFVVYSNDRPEAVRLYTERLEKFDAAVRALRGMPDPAVTPAARVKVYLSANGDELHRMMGKGSRFIGGRYQARASGPVVNMAKNLGDGTADQAIMLHEYSHHIMYSVWGDTVFPGWFSEGFAEFHSTARFPADGSVVFGAVPMMRRYTVGMMNVVPAPTLLTSPPDYTDGLKGDAFYARSWLLTHYLMFDPERRAQLGAYIKAVNEGVPFGEAAKTFGNPSTLDLKMNSWGKRAMLPSVAFTAAELPLGPIKVRQLSPAEAAAMPAQMWSQYGIDPKTSGPTVLDLARKAAAAYPNDPAANNELAEAEYDMKNYAASEAAADRVLAVDPKSVHALLYKGMAKSAALKAAKVSDPAQWQAARKPIVTANKLEPEYAEPLVQYYQTFVDASQAPTDNAEKGLLYAQAMAPADPGVRLTATKILLRQNKPAEAKKMLQPLAFSLEGPSGSASFIRKALDAIDSGGSKAALVILEDGEAKARSEAEKSKA